VQLNHITQKWKIIVVRTEVAVRRELGGVGLGPAQVRGVPPVEQTMPHKRARCAIGASCPHMGYKLDASQLICRMVLPWIFAMLKGFSA
jgi:hypothetical protein